MNNIVNCNLCNHKISSEAKNCPNCGKKTTYGKGNIDQRIGNAYKEAVNRTNTFWFFIAIALYFISNYTGG